MIAEMVSSRKRAASEHARIEKLTEPTRARGDRTKRERQARSQMIRGAPAG
jgi:hypothetical protein